MTTANRDPRAVEIHRAMRGAVREAAHRMTCRTLLALAAPTAGEDLAEVAARNARTFARETLEDLDRLRDEAAGSLDSLALRAYHELACAAAGVAAVASDARAMHRQVPDADQRRSSANRAGPSQRE